MSGNALRATVFVCTSCRRSLSDGNDKFDHPGPVLAERVRELLADDATIDVVVVDCLAVCKRPCTVALAGEGKWTYVVGDLDNVAHCDEVAAADPRIRRVRNRHRAMERTPNDVPQGRDLAHPASQF